MQVFSSSQSLQTYHCMFCHKAEERLFGGKVIFSNVFVM